MPFTLTGDAHSITHTATLSANRDADLTTLKLDVDGASTYSEAGSVLHLIRDVTNATENVGGVTVP
jgi:hypothetical protein